MSESPRSIWLKRMDEEFRARDNGAWSTSSKASSRSSHSSRSVKTGSYHESSRTSSARISANGHIFYEPKPSVVVIKRPVLTVEERQQELDKEHGLSFRPSIGRAPLVRRSSFNSKLVCSHGASCKRCYVEEPSYRPRMSLRSEELAALRRPRGSKHDELYDERTTITERKLQDLELKALEEVAACTFTPTVHDKSNQLVDRIIRRHGSLEAFYEQKDVSRQKHLLEKQMVSIEKCSFLAAPAPPVLPVQPAPGMQSFFERIDKVKRRKEAAESKTQYKPRSSIPYLAAHTATQESPAMICFGPYPTKDEVKGW